jgi:hypothetical protein
VQGGKPRLVGSKTTAGADLASAVVLIAGKTWTWGEVVAEALYELEAAAFLLYDPIRDRLYVSTDATTVAAWKAEVTPTATCGFAPATGQRSIFLIWEALPGGSGAWSSFVASYANGRTKSLSQLVTKIFASAAPGRPVPFILVDQVAATVALVEVADNSATSDAIDEVEPAGDSICLTLGGRAGLFPLVFEGGTT